MAEEYKKSRFKRKKLFNDSCLTELVTYNKSSESCEVTNRSAVHAHEWWVRDDLSGEQRLWTFSLKSALQCFESESWGPVPELPAAIITSSKPKPSEWRWCNPSEEVIPFPESSPPPCPPVVFLSPPPDSLHLSPSLERTLDAPAESRKTLSTLGLPKHTPCQQYLPGEGTSSTGQGHSSRDNSSKERGPKTTFKVRGDKKDTMAKTGPLTLQHNTVYARSASLPESHHPSTQQWMRGSLPGSRSDEKKVEEEKEQGSLIKRQLPAHRAEASDSCTATMRVEEMRRKGEKEGVVSGSCGVDPGRGTASEEAAGGGGIQSCPMCLVVFPAGFTQMDCDGHLAQCLSEMNVDMAW
ncbi:uncharacterized protein si:ch73-70k4.1 [Hypomesus transpacificus]|uniref:uncharacterized protein si:ch73-70k4.1 n=1 Tax=Hypomesus transpacificus TaxID=137520 RepID=UPI001F07C1EC|nr:uncharacterized protein si:ch73-70k4.1 [Hypomesus transpacificus]